jgi:hypothetical protein
MAQAADQAYAKDPVPPEGYRVATNDDLASLGLDPSQIDHPIDPQTKKPSQFRAVVFMGDKGQPPIVAFRGSQSMEDFTRANVPQSAGEETFHYTQAQAVARRVTNSAAGSKAHFTGHSLGGGLASAAARTTGNPATTFNAAGLHANTVKNPSSSPIDAVYVKGELVTVGQALAGRPAAAATERWALNPPPTVGSVIVAGLLAAGRFVGAAAAQGYRSFELHKMENVTRSLKMERNRIQKQIEANRC